MKPTQEQVLQWAREAGYPEWLISLQQELAHGFTLAYEAGRKDENEACAELCCSYEKLSSPTVYLTGYTYAQAIRARGQE